jgi:diacylglycerol O-acyltransferase / wax synthase
MTLVRQLSREDVMFVAGETETVYQHIGLLVILDPSENPDFSFDYFRQQCIERIALIPHFRWKLHSVPLGLDRPYWVEDEHFDYDHHIKRVALPKPGDQTILNDVAANLYSTHLDRTKPLWEIWLIEGLEGGKCAYVQKFHHCMMDGEGAFKMIEILCDLEPWPSEPKQVDASISSARAGKAPSMPERSRNFWRHMSQLPGDAARGTYDILRPKILEQFVWPRKKAEDRPVVPSTCFNREISSERAMAACSLPIATLLAIKKHFGVSLNDLVLALVADAIRHYLIDMGELPEAPLRTNIPVSLRSESDDSLSNKVTNTTITLATHMEDPIERLLEIHRESSMAKARAHEGGGSIVEIFQMMPPIMISSMMDSLPAEQAPQILGANLIVSNVRGMPVPMYMAGARIEHMYPMSIITAGMAINFTCISYHDQMEFGIMVDPDQVPEHTSIANGLLAALKTYKQASSGAGKKASGKKRKRSA